MNSTAAAATSSGSNSEIARLAGRVTQMSLTRGKGHQLGFHRAVMASLIAKGHCCLRGSHPRPDRGPIGRSVSPPPTSTAG
jgi:hypothetical protein